jgi:hypothetical protein
MELYTLETAHYADSDLVQQQAEDLRQEKIEADAELQMKAYAASKHPHISYDPFEEDPEDDYDVEAVNQTLQEQYQAPAEALRMKARLFEGVRPEVLHNNRRIIGDFVALMKEWQMMLAVKPVRASGPSITTTRTQTHPV